jgi:hypothetical protein
MLTHPLRILALALLLAASGCNKSSSGEQTSSAGSTAGWKELSSPEGRFSVLLLANPKQEKSQISKPEGKIDTVSYLAATPEGRAYSVAYSDYPEAWVKTKSPDEMLDGARDGAVARIKGNLLSEQKITIDGAAGRELFIVGDGEPLTVQARLLTIDGRLYVLQALSVGALHNVPDPDAERFFTSFRLTKK